MFKQHIGFDRCSTTGRSKQKQIPATMPPTRRQACLPPKILLGHRPSFRAYIEPHKCHIVASGSSMANASTFAIRKLRASCAYFFLRKNLLRTHLGNHGPILPRVLALGVRRLSGIQLRICRGDTRFGTEIQESKLFAYNDLEIQLQYFLVFTMLCDGPRSNRKSLDSQLRLPMGLTLVAR